jgi:murein DD-endopeptidase MepM/ murein hydrolase activator NlpD
VETRSELDLFGVPGVVRAGLVAGLLLSLALVVLGRVAEMRRAHEARAAFPGAAGGEEPRRLLFPIQDVDPDTIVEGFAARRGLRRHEAVDVPAPRGTPVRAAADGTVELTTHPGAGITVEQNEASGRYCLVYAHLDRYAPGLSDGAAVVRGQTIGYVGTTGNAPPNAPHLHFAAHVRADGGCWSGTAVDPLLLFVD